MSRASTSSRPRDAEPPPRRVVRHGSADHSWEAVFQDPSSPLRPYIVGGYQGWREDAKRIVRRREIPSSSVAWIVNLGRPFHLLDPNELEASPRALGSFVAGLHESYALVESPGSTRCIQVDFTPIGARLFFGVPMGSLTNLVVDDGDVLGEGAGLLVERLCEARDWPRRFSILESYISGRILAANPPAEGVVWAWNQLEASGGQVGIGGLSSEIGCSPKHLIAQFRDHVGVPPKTLARILRFRKALNLLEANAQIRWVDVALRSGYYDQAHLIRDFRGFTGCTPTEYLGRMLPDGGGNDGS